MIEHLPILMVVIPMIAAVLCSIMPSGRWAWLITVSSSIAIFTGALGLLALTQSQEVISYAIGGWEAPWGIEYRIDTVNAMLLVIISGISTIVGFYAYASVNQEIQPDLQKFFYSAYLLCVTGLLGISATADAFNVFVFLEISSLATYALVAMGKDRRALTAAYRYLIMGTIGATFILLGIGFMYIMTGTLNMADLAAKIPEVAHTKTIRAACAFLTVGLGIKMAIFPLHRWMPNAYSFAPSAVSALISGTATKVALYLLLRFFYSIFGPTLSFSEMNLDRILIPLSLVAIVAASITAIYKLNLKRLLAYSSVAQIGYITLCFSLYSQNGLTAGLLHMFNHALIKCSLFMVAGCIMYRLGTARISEMHGLAKEMPWTFAAFALSGLSIIGVPLTVGFVSKWHLLIALHAEGYYAVMVLMLITSLLAVIYIWKVIEAAYLKPKSEDQAPIKEAPWALLAPTYIMVLLNIYFGVHTDLTISTAQRAAELLIGGTW